MSILKVCFFGSSSDSIAKQYDNDLKIIVGKIFSYANEKRIQKIKVVSGGYQGVMRLIGEYAKAEYHHYENIDLEVYGILYSGYKNAPTNSPENIYGSYNDFLLTSTSIGHRADTMIQHADIFIALPGSLGTLHEISTLIEYFKYGRGYNRSNDFKKLLLHSNWRGVFWELKEKSLISNDDFNDLLFFDYNDFEVKFDLASQTTLSQARLEESNYLPASIFHESDKVPNDIQKAIKLINKAIHENYTDENYVLGIDLAIAETRLNVKNLFRLETVSTTKYANLLSTYLSEFESVLLNTISYENTAKRLSTGKIKSKNSDNKLAVQNVVFKPSKRHPSTFDTWCDFLEKENYGRTAFLLNIPIELDHSIYNAAVFLLLSVELSKSFQDKITLLLAEFLTKAYSENIFKELNDRIRIHSVRSAISQVMARNMSHNIGSHVLSKLITKDYVKNLHLSKEEVQQYIVPSWVTPPSTLESKVATFNSYLRTRMDYLADIATGRSGMEVSRYLLSDILNNLFQNTILLNHISGLDNFRYDIEIRDCRNCPDNYTLESHRLLDTNKDIPISVPNDIFGFHALYTIIENVIRNTAKHSGIEQRKVTFGLEVRDAADPSLYEIILYDDVKRSNKIILSESEAAEYIRLCGESEILNKDGKMKKINWLVFKQNNRLNNSVIDSRSNTLRHGSWGLIEMDVSAAYLRKIPIENVEKKEFEIDICDQNHRFRELENGKRSFNLLKAINRNDCLGYRFFLMKPKEILIVDESQIFQLPKKEELKLNEFGIWVVDSNELNYYKIYPHLFCIVFAGSNFDVSKYLNQNFPNRLIVCANGALVKSNRRVAVFDLEHPITRAIKEVKVEKESFDDERIVEYAWKIWLANKMDYFKVLSTDPIPLSDYINNDELIEGKNLGVIFDDHGENHKELLPQYDYYEVYNAQTKDIVEVKLEDHIEIEDPSSNSKVKKRLVENPYFDKIELFKFGDGVFAQVLILDERIQDISMKHYSTAGSQGEGILIRNLLEKVNVIVPHPKSNGLDLNSSNFKGYTKKLKQELRSIVDNIENKVIHGLDFVVIHLGVIEKILQSEGRNKEVKDVKDFIDELRNTHPELSLCKFVITSGRGRPDNLPEDIPFLGFSVLSQYCIENRFKSFLTQALYAARPLN